MPTSEDAPYKVEQYRSRYRTVRLHDRPPAPDLDKQRRRASGLSARQWKRIKVAARKQAEAKAQQASS